MLLVKDASNSSFSIIKSLDEQESGLICYKNMIGC